MHPASQNFSKYLDVLFPEKVGETDRQVRNRENMANMVRALYENDRNAGGYGNNAWSAYNAVVEYLDHYRDATPGDRAIASMTTHSMVTQKKMKAQEFLLSLS